MRRSKDVDVLSLFEPESSESASRRAARDVDRLKAANTDAAPEAPVETQAGPSLAHRRTTVVTVRPSKHVDALSLFEPESSEWASRRDARDEDWLKAFNAAAALEAPVETQTGPSLAHRRTAVVTVRPSKDVDALSLFEPEPSESASRRDAKHEELRVSSTAAAPDAPAETRAGPSIAHRRTAVPQQPQGVSVGSIAASAVVLLLSAIAGAWVVGALRVPAQEPQDVQPVASTPSPPGPSARVAPDLPRPSAPAAARTAPAAAISEGPEPPPPTLASERTPERVSTTERASRPAPAGSESASRASTNAAGEGVARPGMAGSPPREPSPLVPPVLAGEPRMAEWSALFVLEAPPTPSRSEEAVAVAKEAADAEAERAAAVVAVRQALRSYQDAYARMDVAAAADVWPSVDRRTLSRAFDALRSQGLVFDSCAVSVTGAQATAQCRGALEIVRRVGNSLPMIIEQKWVFALRSLDAEWKIETVSVSQVQDPE